jgi:hypothetical protein
VGDSGEGLIDADSRIQERMEELERERTTKRGRDTRDAEREEALESLRLARTELERQLAATTNQRRRAQIAEAIEEIGRRMAAQQAPSSAGRVHPPASARQGRRSGSKR